MAAAETASAAGTRRAVVRSERFVQWQRQLNSARRAPYGSRKQNADGKVNGIQNQQMKSEEGIRLKNSTGLCNRGEENHRDGNGISQDRVRKHQQQSVDCNGAEKAFSPQFRENGQLILRESVPCNAQQSQQEQQLGPLLEHQELVQSDPFMRGGRQTVESDHELQFPTRGEGEDANGLGGKRSTRSHTRTQRTAEEASPPPLKLPRLQVVLSRKEVQEDWIKMTGQRYTGKPRKSALSHLGLELCTSMTCASTLRRYLNDF